MLRRLTVAQMLKTTTRINGYDSDSNSQPVPGGGGGDPPPSDPPGSGSDDADIDYAYSAINIDESDALEEPPTEFSYYIPITPREGGSGGGYDSADYNGPDSVYIDYFATQHGPDSIEYRSSIVSNAFFNYLAHQDQIRANIDNIIRQAPNVATANQQIGNYLGSVGLGGQLSTSINETSFAAAKQSMQTNSDEIIVNGNPYRVSQPATFVGYGSEGQFMLASLFSDNNQSIETYGSLEGVPASKKYPGLYLMPKNPTDAQKAAVIYNETRGIQDPVARQIVAALVMQVIQNNLGREYLVAPLLARVSGSEQQAAWTAATNAVQQYRNIIASVYDTTSQAAGATNYIMRERNTNDPWMNLPSLGNYGPFNASGFKVHYINFFRDPAYAK